jgi:hypothetical protein
MADASDNFGEIGAGIGIGEDNNPPATVLAKDLIWTIGLTDIRDLARGYPARGRLNEEIAKPLRRAHVLRQPHGHIEAPVAVDDARHDATVGQAAELLDHGGRLHAIERGSPIVYSDFKLRDERLFFDLQIDEPGHLCQTLQTRRMLLVPERR